MNLGTAHVIRADSRTLPLPDNTVDLVVTSPPYFALRSYQDGGEHYAGQIGDEPTPAEFVNSLLEVTAECVRVLKPSGSLWVNLGDKYTGSGMGGNTSLANSDDYLTKRAEGYHPCTTTAPTNATENATTSTKDSAKPASTRTPRKPLTGLPPSKSLIGIPWRYALRCIDDLGLILRAELIWAKPNGLPESVTDRVRRSHEQWFHFTLAPRYFSAVDEIREPHLDTTRPVLRQSADDRTKHRQPGNVPLKDHALGANPLGKLPGSVWTIPTEPLKVPDHLGVDHFAAFPTEWPKRIIRGWSPAGVCVVCGEGRRPVSVGEKVPHYAGGSKGARNGKRREGTANDDDALPRTNTVVTITGYACACPTPAAPTTPAVVLDVFGGTGTTAMVAKALGRTGISVDMSNDYCRLAQWRTSDRNQLAKILGVDKVDAPDTQQLDLFGGDAA